jgi:hypothetical protein
MSWATAPNCSTCKNTSLRTKSRHLLLQLHFSLLMLQEPKSFFQVVQGVQLRTYLFKATYDFKWSFTETSIHL